MAAGSGVVISPAPARRPRWLLPALAAATLVVGWPLLLPRVYDTHDGHYAFYNLAQFDRALRDGQFPVRWLPDLFGGRGLPLFLYYHPLAFGVAELLHFAGLGYIASIKGVYLISLALSGVAMYAWLKDLLPPAAAGVGAVAFLLAPFRVVEIHVKGDPPAALAYVFLPLVLLSIRRAATGARRAVPMLALASAGLVLCHSLTALIMLPAAALYALTELHRPFSPPLARLGLGVGGGALLSAFQWLPALAEKPLVRVDSPEGILFFDFRDHFVEAWQWLSPLWGYHGSFPGPRDDMSFQVGPVHAVGLLAGLAAWRGMAREPGSGPPRRLAAWASTIALASFLLMLPVSRPVWEAIGPLRYLQFPWRLLAPLTLVSSALLAIACSRLPAARLLTAAVAAPPGITLAFALSTGNRWYSLLAAAYGLAAGAIWSLHRLGSSRFAAREAVGPFLCLLLLATALPWSAVPLHSRWRGEPAVVALTEADLAPQRVRLGRRRTTARFDYVPRTVKQLPPLDPAEEYLPRREAVADPDLRLLDGDLRAERIERSSTRFAFSGEATTASTVALDLHDFPGWEARRRSGATGEWMPLPHASDEEGRILLRLPAGHSDVEVTFQRTSPRRAGDLLSLAGLLFLVISLSRRAAASPPAG